MLESRTVTVVSLLIVKSQVNYRLSQTYKYTIVIDKNSLLKIASDHLVVIAANPKPNNGEIAYAEFKTPITIVLTAITTKITIKIKILTIQKCFLVAQ